MNEHSATAGRKNLAQNQARAGTAYHLRDNLRSHPCCDRELTSRMEMRFWRASRLSLKWESCFPGGGPRACLFLVTHPWKITCSSMRTGVNRTFNKYNRQGYSAAGSPAVREYKLGFSPSCSSSTPEVITTGKHYRSSPRAAVKMSRRCFWRHPQRNMLGGGLTSSRVWTE